MSHHGSLSNTVDGERVSVAEAARRLGVSERTVYRYVKSGRLLSDNISGKTKVIIPKNDNCPEKSTIMSDKISEKIMELESVIERMTMAQQSLVEEQARLRTQLEQMGHLLDKALQANATLQTALLRFLSVGKDHGSSGSDVEKGRTNVSARVSPFSNLLRRWFALSAKENRDEETFRRKEE